MKNSSDVEAYHNKYARGRGRGLEENTEACVEADWGAASSATTPSFCVNPEFDEPSVLLKQEKREGAGTYKRLIELSNVPVS